MRYFIVLLLALTIGMASADEIACYQHGKLIMRKKATDFSYQDGVFAFKEANSDRVVFASMDCIVKIDL